jgi:hypothetical protein
MAIPRVFVSSTFYDLRQIRADLELFIRETGYEPVLHERGAVPYGSKEKLEEYAYREVELADIVVSIVGGRFGTTSQHEDRSISQEELRRALARGTQVYIFVEQSVLVEYQTYRTNKDVDGIAWRYVDDPRVYAHLEQLYALPVNNTIQAFETAGDITDFLKKQWAGLFHRFLQEQARSRELDVLGEMQSTVATLDRVVSFLQSENREHSEQLSEILSVEHPAFARLRQLLKVSYPVFFRTFAELNRWLTEAENFIPLDEGTWDDVFHWEWRRDDRYLKISKSLFDEDDRLVFISREAWDDDAIQLLPMPTEEEELERIERRKVERVAQEKEKPPSAKARRSPRRTTSRKED